MLDKLVRPTEPFDRYLDIIFFEDFKDCRAKTSCQDIVFQSND